MDFELISSIMGLPCQGDDPTLYLHANRDTTKMKQKYDLQCIGRGFLISPIVDNMVSFAVKILSCKLLCKMRPSEWIVRMVELAVQ